MSRSTLIESLRRLIRPAAAGSGDAELLHAFAASRDEAAFAELVRRHGGLVWSVCRRILRHDADAEDAFQATFLVLARRADTLQRGAALASWLYGVACRTALAARRRAARREQPPPPSPSPDPAESAATAEACALILDEVRRLPEKYRTPIVLCGLSGRTKADVARELGWKEGTVSGRLARARALLARRLARRGVGAAAVAFGTLTGAAAPPALRAATLDAAVRFMSDTGGGPAAVALAREVLSAMTAPRPHLGAWIAALTVLAAAAAGLAFFGPSEQADDPSENPPPQAAVPGQPRWQEAARLYGFSGSASRQFSPDGRVMAAINDEHQLVFWDTATWQEQARFDVAAVYSGRYLAYTPFTGDGKTVAIVGSIVVPGEKQRRPEVTLIDPATGRERGRVAGSDLALAPRGRLLAVRRGDRAVIVDATTLKELHTIPVGPPIKYQLALSFAPDGTTLIARDTGGTRLWDAATGQARAAVAGFNPELTPNGRTLTTVLPGPVVKVWDAATGAERATNKDFNRPGVGVVFSPDSRLALLTPTEYGVTSDGTLENRLDGQRGRAKLMDLDIRLCDTATGAELARLPGKIRLCRIAQFAPDGRTIIYQRQVGAGDDMEVVLWDAATRTERAVLRQPGGIDGLFIPPGGSHLFGFAGYNDGGRSSMRVWDIATGREQPRLGPAAAIDQPGFFASYSPDGTTFVLHVTLPGGKVGESPPTELRVFRLSATPVVRVTRGTQPVPAPEEPKLSTPAEKEWQTLSKEGDAADAQFARDAEGAKTPEQQRALGAKRSESIQAFAARAAEIARRHPNDPAAIDALEYALRCTNGSTEGKGAELARSVVALVRQNYLSSEQMGRLVPWLTHQHRDDADELLQAAFDSSPHRAVRGRAGFWLARALTDRAEAARLFRQMPELADHPDVRTQPARMKWLRDTDPAAVEQRAERLYERLGKDYADVPTQEGIEGAIGPTAERALFALRHLGIGKVAPEIDGKDLDGKAFKLSELRGKVVVLVFCGGWCGPCRALEPHHRALMKRLSGQPFALVEVNSDDDLDLAKERKTAEGNTWRCWFDGGREGPIHQRWNVTRWPTVIVLDRKGVIRFKDLHDAPLDKAVDALLKERD